jgi:hypothetical protein
MAQVEVARDVGGRKDDDEGPLLLDLAVFGQLRLEEALLLPPFGPGRLDGDRVVRLEVGVVEGFDP